MDDHRLYSNSGEPGHFSANLLLSPSFYASVQDEESFPPATLHLFQRMLGFPSYDLIQLLLQTVGKHH